MSDCEALRGAFQICTDKIGAAVFTSPIVRSGTLLRGKGQKPLSSKDTSTGLPCPLDAAVAILVPPESIGLGNPRCKSCPSFSPGWNTKESFWNNRINHIIYLFRLKEHMEAMQIVAGGVIRIIIQLYMHGGRIVKVFWLCIFFKYKGCKELWDSIKTHSEHHSKQCHLVPQLSLYCNCMPHAT